MTTIAFKDGVLAVDRQCTDGSLKYESTKAQIVGSMLLIPVGSLGYGMAMFAWWRAGEDAPFPVPPTPEDDACLIEFNMETGEVAEWVSPGQRLVVEDRIAAWGSGRDLAIGAMAAGATPERAVDIAAAWDTGTGFGVDVFRAEARKRRAKRAT